MTKIKETNTEVKKQETVVVTVKFNDGQIYEQTLYLQDFKVNETKGFQNSGYSLQGSFNNYKLNIVIIDSLKKKNI